MLAKRIGLLALAAVVIQALNLIFLPFILRLFPPAQYGAFATFSAVFASLLPLATLSLPYAIALSASRLERRLLSAVCFTVSTLLALLLLLVIVVAVGLYQLPLFYLIMPFTLLSASAWLIQQQNALRKGKVNTLAKVELVVALLANVLKIALASYSATTLTLILVFTLVFVLQAFWLGWRYIKPCLRYVPLIMRRQRQFVFFQMPQQWLNAASLAIPVVSLNAFYSASAAGFYALAATVLLLPASLISKAAADIYLVELAKVKQKKQPLWPLLKQFLIIAVPAVFVFGVLVFYLAPYLFPFVFGSNWQQAGVFAQLMLPWTLLVMLNPPFLRVFMVFKQQKIALTLNVLTFMLRLAVVVCVTYFNLSVYWFVILFTLTGFLHNLVIILLACRLVGFTSGERNNG